MQGTTAVVRRRIKSGAISQSAEAESLACLSLQRAAQPGHDVLGELEAGLLGALAPFDLLGARRALFHQLEYLVAA